MKLDLGRDCGYVTGAAEGTVSIFDLRRWAQRSGADAAQGFAVGVGVGVRAGCGVAVRSGVALARGGVGVARGVDLSVAVGLGVGDAVGVGAGVGVNVGSGRGVNEALAGTVALADGDADAGPERTPGTNARAAPATMSPPMSRTRATAMALPSQLEDCRRSGGRAGGTWSMGSVGSRRSLTSPMLPCRTVDAGMRSPPHCA